MALFIKIHLGIALQACKSAAWCAARRARPIKLVPTYAVQSLIDLLLCFSDIKPGKIVIFHAIELVID